jgi:hypothetical protein
VYVTEIKVVRAEVGPVNLELVRVYVVGKYGPEAMLLKRKPD